MFALGLAALTAPAPAGAAIELGATFTPTANCASSISVLQSGSPPETTYAAPFDGVITAWSFQAGSSPPTLRFIVGHPEGGNTFTLIAASEPLTPTASQLNRVLVRIPVRAGDVLGLNPQTSGFCQRSASPPYQTHSRLGATPTGSPFTFTPAALNVQLDVSATLEPDADGDGFGDETQDACPTEGDNQGPCVPPETTITRRPAERSTKKKATFEFTSSDAGSSFECAVDGQALKVACASPYDVKVKKGKHSFRVRAVDPGGIVDGSPATDTWKVKKKKK